MTDPHGFTVPKRYAAALQDQWRAGFRDYGILLALIALFVALSIASPAFLSRDNLLNVLDQWATTAIVASAGTLVVIAGGFDLSVGGIFALSGIVAAVVTNSSGVGAGLLAALALGAALGIANGLVITRLRIHSFLATLASGLIIRGAAVIITGASVIVVSNGSFLAIANGTAFGVQYPVFIAVGAILLLAFILATCGIGENVYAVGGSAEAASAAGINVNMVRGFTYAVSGTWASLGGILFASRVAGGQANAGGTLEFTAITAIVLGGTSIFGGEGAIWRTVVGVLILALIGNGFNLLAVNPVYQPIVYGGIIAGAVALDAWTRSAGSTS